MIQRVDVRKIRQNLNMTQDVFALTFGFQLGTLRNWEQGHRAPSGPSRTLLMIISRAPEMVRSALESEREAAIRQ
jgi:putative transcriptional regulator